MPTINYREMKRRYDLDGPDATSRHLKTAIQEGQLKPRDFRIRELAEALIPDGCEFVRMLDPRNPVSPRVLKETADAVDSSAFVNISGQIVFSAILEAYNNPKFIGGELVTTVPTEFNGEKIPGIAALGDKGAAVDEGEPYPHVGTSANYIETPTTTKYGLIVPITKEALFFDRTNVLLDRCRYVGESLGIRKEKAIIDLVTGQTNNYKRNGTAYNTYYASGDSGPWTNKITDALADHTDIEAAELIFESMTDLDTREPILIMPWQILVPGALRPTALRITNMTEVRSDANASAGTRSDTMITVANVSQYQVVSSPYVYTRTSQSNDWWIGDFKKAFAYMENWPITVTESGAGSEDDFNRDIVLKFKASERGAPAVLNPQYVVMSTGGS